MKKILLFLFLLNFQFSFSQVITIECNNMIITVNWEEIANNPNAYLDWDEDGDIDEDDAMIYLYETYDCDNLQEQESCGDYVTIVIDCAECQDNEEMIFWQEVDELNCTITEGCSCIPINNNESWNDIDWVDPNWSEFDWETIWADLDLDNIVDWDDIPWGDIINLNILPEDFIIYIQNLALGQSFNWEEFIIDSTNGGEDGECCVNPEWIDPMAVCFMIFDPVIGCDGVEYSNSCVAEASGITSYTDSMGEVTILEWDCGQGGEDCIDDPEGILEQYGSSCSELSILGCDADLSDFIQGIGFGISVYEICPESCTDCGENDCIDDPEGILASPPYFYQCNDIINPFSPFDCDSDLSSVIDGFVPGISLYEICECSCEDDEAFGCTDINACNYDPDALEDDGSCEYEVDCFESPCSIYPSPFPGASCVDDYCGECCAIWTWTNEEGFDFTFDSCTDEYTEGCTESNAVNFNPDANLDDGSCEYPWDDCPNQQLLETFGDYNQGNIDPQSNNWIGWDNSNSGVDVVDFSMSTYLGDSQSILVEQDDDLIWDFDDVNAGSGQVIFHMYIPSEDNAGAYYNMLHDYAAANSNWAFQVFFAPASSSEQSYVDLDQPVYFDAVYDTWVQVRHEIDIDNDTISLYYNGELITSWAFSTGSTGFSSVLDALNLYGFCTGNPCNGFTYYDNIEICGNFYDNTNIDDDSVINTNIYPNPNSGSFNLVVNRSYDDFSIKIFNILGKEVYNENVDNYFKNSVKNLDLDLLKGTYIVNLDMKDRVINIPIIIE